MSVDLADRVAFSNHPDAQSDGGWPQVLHTFPQPIPVSAGEQLDVMVGHDRRSLIVTPAPGAPRQEERLSGEMVVRSPEASPTGNPNGTRSAPVGDAPRKAAPWWPMRIISRWRGPKCLKNNLTGQI